MDFLLSHSSWRVGMRKTVSILGVVIGLLLTSAIVSAQVNQGRILGSVRDQTGGAIAGATVT